MISKFDPQYRFGRLLWYVCYPVGWVSSALAGSCQDGRDRGEQPDDVVDILGPW